MELFEKIIKGWKPLIIFTKSSILEVFITDLGHCKNEFITFLKTLESGIKKALVIGLLSVITRYGSLQTNGGKLKLNGKIVTWYLIAT